MKILVIGSGGREHAIIKTLAKNPEIEKIYALPGNGGIAAQAQCVPIEAKNISAAVEFALEKGIDFAVVAPDDPLALGAVDAFEAAGIAAFGPDKAAAEIESSKVFSKRLMQKYGIPTASFETFSDMEAALKYVETAPIPLVVKADGLALGKGVIIAVTREEAVAAVRTIMGERAFGESGNRVVIEEYLEGPEVSVLSFTDGESLIPMLSSMDHKRAFDGDKGLNTGGMGAVSPNPYYTEDIAARCREEIFLPTIRAMKAEGRPFKGCLYFGLMLTKNGPKVIEYNCRFGDPETQAVLPLLKSDLLTVMRACRDGHLEETAVEFSEGASCFVVMASQGYPAAYEKGFEIEVSDKLEAELYIAGAKTDGEKLLTSGGRVLGVTATAATLEQAVKKAYEEIEKVSFKNAFYRRDIGARALAAPK